MTSPLPRFARTLLVGSIAVLLAPLAGLIGSADTSLDRTPRGPILVHGDDDLCDPILGGAISGVRNCDTADGTAANPYVISGWQIFGGTNVGGSLGDPVVGVNAWAVYIAETTAHVLIKDNEVMTDREALGILVEGSSHVTLQGNVVHGRITAIGVRDSPGTLVIGNHLDMVSDDVGGAHGIIVVSPDVVVLDNVLELSGEAFFVTRGIQVDRLGVVVDGNRMNGPFNPSFLLSGAALSNVAAGLAGFGDGNLMDGEPLLVLRNRAHETFDFGTLDGSPVAVVDSHDVEVRGADASRHPFLVYGSTDVRVVGGVFGGLELVGLGNDGAIGIAKSEAVSVTDCRVLRGTNEAIQISRSSHVTIKGCTLRGEDLGADHLFHGHIGARAVSCILSDNVTVQDNFIQDWLSRGVELVACRSVAVTGNLLTEKRTEDAYQIPFQHHPASHSFLAILAINSQDVLIADNRIPGVLGASEGEFASSGIQFFNVDATVRGNELSNLDGTGMSIFNSRVTLHGNTLAGIAETALVLGGTTDANLHRNEFTGNALAIDVLDGSILMRHNNFEGNLVALRADSTPVPVDARLNWWGSPDGPSVAGPGTGDAVVELPGADVLLEPWLTEPAST